MAHSCSSLFDLPTTGLRCFTVYGPWGRPDMALFLFTRNILAGKPIAVFNHGHHTRDFTYVDDIVAGVIRPLDRVPGPAPAYDPLAPSPAPPTPPSPFYTHCHTRPVAPRRSTQVLQDSLARHA